VAFGVLLPSAAAEPTAHYDPDRLPAASQVFVELSKASTSAVAPIERALVQTDGALADLEVALGLVGGSIDPPQHAVWMARLDERSTRFFGEAEAFQEEVYAIGDAFQTAFEAATARALATIEGDVAECREPQTSALGALAGRTESKPSTCPGDDATAEIAAAWDRDAVLADAIAPLREALKTTVTTYDEEVPVLGLGGAEAGRSWVSPPELTAAVPEAVEILDAIESRADEARAVLRQAKDSLAPDDPIAEDLVKAIRARARGIRTWTADRRGELGAALFEAIDRNRKRAGKKGGWADVGVCVNPDIWSGCSGTNATDAVTEALMKDKKLQKALDRMLVELAEPETSL
jgi:hypothetical protein